MSDDLRVAFVGETGAFGLNAMPSAAAGVAPTFVGHRPGDDAAPLVTALRALAPDVVVVFRPETVAAGALREIDALALGVIPEALPRPMGSVTPLAEPQGRLSALAATDRLQFDRIVSVDPLSAAAARTVGVDVWRSLPLPVSDRVFDAGPRVPAPRARVAFVGASTDHRERFLLGAKHRHDVLHVASGLVGERLLDQLGRTDVAIVLGRDPDAGFEHGVARHLAAGHLVLTEPLRPAHGLEAGVDLLEVTSPDGLLRLVDAVRAQPDAFRAVRWRGRRKAEQFRASRVWPRLLADLRADVAAFGRR